MTQYNKFSPAHVLMSHGGKQHHDDAHDKFTTAKPRKYARGGDVRGCNSTYGEESLAHGGRHHRGRGHARNPHTGNPQYFLLPLALGGLGATLIPQLLTTLFPRGVLKSRGGRVEDVPIEGKARANAMGGYQNQGLGMGAIPAGRRDGRQRNPNYDPNPAMQHGMPNPAAFEPGGFEQWQQQRNQRISDWNNKYTTPELQEQANKEWLAEGGFARSSLSPRRARGGSFDHSAYRGRLRDV